jgi:hypothetical protein
MDANTLKNQILEEFDLQGLSPEDQDEMLVEISKTIQKQFLFDVYDALGPEKFGALQASANMGEEFYNTTLKHLLPSYEEVFADSKKKVVTAFKENK